MQQTSAHDMQEALMRGELLKQQERFAERLEALHRRRVASGERDGVAVLTADERAAIAEVIMDGARRAALSLGSAVTPERYAELLLKDGSQFVRRAVAMLSHQPDGMHVLSSLQATLPRSLHDIAEHDAALRQAGESVPVTPKRRPAPLAEPVAATRHVGLPARKKQNDSLLRKLSRALLG